ncbi:16S rRNA (guanine(966)-N(2))-methyltransferase RsmD [Candidatus Vidania fulgoroideorum]
MNKKNKSIKIISGKYKNSKIKFPHNINIKPTKLILKKSVFSIIGNFIKNKKCLDLFSGSGSLGFEALSRGASLVVFNDIRSINIKNINKNIKRLNLCESKYILIKNDYKNLLKKNFLFDIIFIDPPFIMLCKISKIIISFSKLLKKKGYIYLETNKVIKIKKPKLSVIRIGKKGKVMFYLFKKSKQN